MKKYKIEDYIGKSYNRITIVGEVREKKEREWTYICSCGGRGQGKPSHLIQGNIKSCGCAKVESNRQNLKAALASPFIGNAGTHGMSGTRPYSIWTGMKSRCNNPNVTEYADYGGRGITYTVKWDTFSGFWEDMEENYSDTLTIERVDTNGNYDKSNCVWDTMKAQSHNRRKQKGKKTSSYIGVSSSKTLGKFRAGIVNPEGVKLAFYKFETEAEAALWYDNYAEEFYGHRPNKTER